LPVSNRASSRRRTDLLCNVAISCSPQATTMEHHLEAPASAGQQWRAILGGKP
jgi:hypothetical protein